MKISLGGKCSDMFWFSSNNEGLELEYDGYVPDDLGFGGSDYIELNVDLETGKIIGWDSEKIKEWIKENSSNNKE